MSDNVSPAVRVRHEQLSTTLTQYNEAYYQGLPLVPDSIYDKLMRDLRHLEANYHTLRKEGSIAEQVGIVPPKGVPLHQHLVPMLSLDNIFEEEARRERYDEALLWCKKTEAMVSELTGLPIDHLSYFVDYKFDGLALALTYVAGQLVSIAMRGNGREGQEIIAMRPILRFNDAMWQFNHPADIRVVKGEAIILKKDLEWVNSQLQRNAGKTYANCRNAVAGILRNTTLEPETLATLQAGGIVPNIHFVPYEVLDWDAARRSFYYRPDSDVIAWRDPMFRAEPFDAETDMPFDDQLVGCFDWIIEHRDALPFDVDGLVLKVKNTKLRHQIEEELPATRVPRWSIAFKFLPDAAETIIIEIEWSVGRTGSLIPTAILRPTKLCGVTVSHASLHNVAYIYRENLRLNEPVIVKRSADVIPVVKGYPTYFEGTLGTPIDYPTTCPACGGPITEICEPGSHIAKDLICTAGLDCVGQHLALFENFVSKDRFDIKGLGPMTLERLYNEGLLENYADLFHLGVNEIGSARVLEEINRASTITMSRFIAALGIPGVGVKTAEAIASQFASLDEFVEAANNDTITGMGVETREMFRKAWWGWVQREVLPLRKVVTVIPEQVVKLDMAQQDLAGLTVVITGEMEGMSRSEMTTDFTRRGAKVVGGVSSKVDRLYVGDRPSLGKIKKAKDLGIEIIDIGEPL